MFQRKSILDGLAPPLAGTPTSPTKNMSWFVQQQSLNTLEYLITVQHLSNVQNGKLDFLWLAKKDNLMLLN